MENKSGIKNISQIGHKNDMNDEYSDVELNLIVPSNKKVNKKSVKSQKASSPSISHKVQRKHRPFKNLIPRQNKNIQVDKKIKTNREEITANFDNAYLKNEENKDIFFNNSH